MSLKCEYLVSSTGEPDDHKTCDDRAKYRVIVNQDDGEFSVCQYHFENLLPDVTVVAQRRVARSTDPTYIWEYDHRAWWL